MNLQFITTKQYYLLVDTEQPISKDMVVLYKWRHQEKVGRITYLPEESRLEEMVEFEGENVDVAAVEHVIGHLPINGAPKLKGVPELPEELDVLAEKALVEHEQKIGVKITGMDAVFWKSGWQANSQKQFSEEQVRKALKVAEVWKYHGNQTTIDEIIQSLRPKPIDFEPEWSKHYYECHNYGGAHLGKDCSCRSGDLREVKEMKIINNVIQGRYLYETSHS